MAAQKTVIYGIYGGKARKIRPDFNVLIIDDSTSLPLRPEASGQTLSNVIYGILCAAKETISTLYQLLSHR